MTPPALEAILSDARRCDICAAHLPLGPRPVVRASASAKLLIIGQAPGTAVHKSGIPWDDPSGQRLRRWLQMQPEDFYNERQVAIVPMGFCYPGKGNSGDLPPRPECAPQWHQQIISQMPELGLILLIGQYAQNYYLPKKLLKQQKTLTERVRHWQSCPPPFLPLPHPSPRNQLWLKKNPWFEERVVPALRVRLQELGLKNTD